MKNDKIEEFKKQLQELEAEVEKLKKENPDDDYTEIDKTLDEYRNIISDSKLKELNKKINKKRIRGLILNFFFHLIVTFSVLGFFISCLSENYINYLYLVIPVISIVVFVIRKMLKMLVFGGPLYKHPILHTILLYLLFCFIISIFDFLFLKFWTSIWYSIIFFVVLGMVIDIGEFIYYRKIILKYKR